MAKKIINSFNAGELSPYLYARTDLDKYGSGCLVMENFLPLPYGGATRRPAVEYIGDSKADDKIRLIPFTASVSNSYIIELGDGYMRFWKDGAIIDDGIDPIEVDTPYAEADLLTIKFAQSVDVMWLTHPSHPAQRLSRLANDEWTLEPEEFDFPPLMEENDTEVTISPSATTGLVTLTASEDFFDAGHVGGYFSFDTSRLQENMSVSEEYSIPANSSVEISEELYVSNANWEFSTLGNIWTARLVLQRSLDAGATWEDYIVIGDTSTTAAASAQNTKNFSLSSDEPEPLGARLRLMITADSAGVNGDIAYNLKCESTTWNTLVKIETYVSATEVTATVFGEFQDTVSDYSAWATSTAYDVGDKVSIAENLTYDSSSSNISATSTGVQGASWDGTYFWVITDDGAGDVRLDKYNSSWVYQASNFDLSSEFDTVAGIEYHLGEIYVSGNESSNSYVKIFNTSGVFQSIAYSNGTPNIAGIAYGDGYWWRGFDLAGSSNIAKFSDAWKYTGKKFNTNANDEQDDIEALSDRFLVANDSQNKIDSFTYGLNKANTYDVSTETTDVSAVVSDGDKIYVISAGGIAYQYSITETTRYYECVGKHTSGSFGTDYDAGRWVERTPAIKDWSEGAFSDYRGHARSVVLFETRLVYGGTASEPDTVWLSRVDDFSDFLTGELDTDGIKVTMGSGQLNGIQWMVSQERLVIGASGAEWSLGASDERKAITPTGFDLKRKTSYGSNDVQAILVNSAVLFLMRQSRKVREWTPNYNIQDYVAPDLSILAEHITEGGIVQWDYQQQPDNILWSIRNDGTLLGFTYERDQNVTGWHRHNNDEFLFESVAVIPQEDAEDEVWVSVNMDGTRIIGRLTDREWGTNYLTEWSGSDLFVTYTSPGTAVLTGLAHLNGKDVVVVGDGVVESTEKTVSGGQITVDSDSYTNVTVGLSFTSTLAPVYPEIESQQGSSQGNKRNSRRATAFFKDTFSAEIGQETTDLEAVKFDPDENALYTEQVPVYFDNGSEFLQTCYIVQQNPMPCTVLAIIPNLEV